MNPKAIAAWVVGSGVGLTILGLAFKMLVSMEVASQLAEAGIVPASQIAAIEENVQDNTDDLVKQDSKIERIAQILMED